MTVKFPNRVLGGSNSLYTEEVTVSIGNNGVLLINGGHVRNGRGVSFKDKQLLENLIFDLNEVLVLWKENSENISENKRSIS